MTILQLNPPIPLVCPKGRGYAHLVIDYSPEHDLMFTIFIDSGEFAGQCWTFSNRHITIQNNITLDRGVPKSDH